MDLGKVQDLWFPDGNIIIRVGNQICCVHRGILAANSPVLSDMLSIPQPSLPDTIKGLPEVTLPDSPQDVVYWLKSIFVPGYFEVYPRPIRLEKVLAVLRLSHKYGVQHLRQCALYHLSTAFPIDLEGVANIHETTIKDHLEMSVEDLLHVNALAQEIGALWLIPFAIYQLHTRTCFNMAAGKVLFESPLVTHLEFARLADVARAATMEFSLPDLIRYPHTSCNRTRPLSCALLISSILLRSHQQLVVTPLTFFQLPPEGFIPGKKAKYDTVHELLCEVLCSACSTAVLRDSYESARRRFWDALARDLGLGFDSAHSMLTVQRLDTGLYEADA